MDGKSRVILGAILAAAAASVAPQAEALTWYWAQGATCQVSVHPPAYELAQARSAGARIVEEKDGRTEIVLPSVEAYQPFRQKGFHFVFFKDEKACSLYLQDQARIKSDQDRAHEEYVKELQKK